MLDRSDQNEPPAGPAPRDDKETGLPLLRTWPAVYAFVLGTFVVWIALLTMLSSAFK